MVKKTLNLSLAKDDIEEFEQVLSETALARIHRPSTIVVEQADFGDGAKLFVFVGDEAQPNWFQDLRRQFRVPGIVTNSSSSAVLAFRANERVFVSTFAHGWMYLEEDNIEGDFGLRVALNSLDDKRLNRLERANLGDALRGVSLSPFQRDFASFGLDDALDLVRKVSGKARSEASAESVSGARSLKLSGEFDLADLPQLAIEALQNYRSIAYRNSSFRVIDFVSPVADRRLTLMLDEMAAETIKAGTDDFELGLPISYSDDNVGYKFAGPGLRGVYPDLLLSHYRAALGDELQELTAQVLREHKVIAIYDDDAKPDQRWSVRSGLVGTLTRAGGRYAINEGEWYRLDTAFEESIRESFIEVVEEWDRRPRPLRKIYDEGGAGKFQSEASYNAELADELGLILLDKEMVTIEGIQRSGFESCDLLDINEKCFIHVKKSSRKSSILSHFFKQGSNSAQQFSRFPSAWERLEVIVERLSGAEARRQLQLAIDDDNRPWSVRFVVADAPRANGNFDLPFFSKISLRDEAITLRAMGYNVGLRFVGLEPDPI